MDRRQKKTQDAIFKAFGTLVAKKHYFQITVQDIIDEADIGRSTFYSHFETKEDLLRALCSELFGHIIATAKDNTHRHGLVTTSTQPLSIFCHILKHIQENDNNIVILLSSDSTDIFMPYFRQEVNGLIKLMIKKRKTSKKVNLPDDFLVNHISGSFVEMVQWWLKNGMKLTPEQLDEYFEAAAVQPFFN